MTHTSQHAPLDPRPLTLDPDASTLDPAPQINPAVAHCSKAWQIAFNAARSRGEDVFPAEKAASEAYRDAMPPLSGYENIRDFIACTAHGLLIQAIPSYEVKNYLYAAQVAVSALRCEPKTHLRADSPKPPKRKAA